MKGRIIYLLVAAMLLIVPGYASADDGWVHSPKPWDFKNGLLDDPDFLKMVNHNIQSELIDNDIDSRLVSGTLKEAILTSDIPFDVSGIFVHGTGNFDVNYVKVTFSDGKVEYFNRKDNGYHDLGLKGIISIELDFKIASTSRSFNEIEFFGSYKKEKFPPVEILNIKPNVENIEVTFKKPDEAIAVDVWLNNQKLERVTTGSYTYQNLMPDTEYNLMFVNYYGDDNYGAAVRETVRTKKEEIGEIKDFIVKAESHKQVNLQWENPAQSNFQHVTIYRDEIGEKKGLLSKLNLMIVAHANDSNKLFETNGTYFFDHSVAAATKYEYLVTTTDDEGKESKGVSQTVTTPKKPNPDPPISEMEKQENGDYLVTWTSPTEGKVKIKVGGKDYVIVDAKDGSFLIPGKDMVYNIFDQPQVEVIAIDLDGDESGGKKPGKPGSSGGDGGNGGGLGGVDPIDANDVLSGTMSFFKLLAPLIVLGLIIYLVPRLVKVIKGSINQQKR